MAGLFLTMPAGAAEFVQPAGTSFEICNAPLKFVGFNLRGICHYGQGDVLPYSHTSDIATNLDYCVGARARVIRVFCSHHAIDMVETGDRLEVVLDACQDRGIWVIPALTDMYANSEMYPQGDGVYYTRPGSPNLIMLNHAFYDGGYLNNYLPQAVYLADRFKEHPALFAWEIGNELRDPGYSATFLAFCRHVRDQIRAVDPNHMIGHGVIDAASTGINAMTLYDGFDFVGTHNYFGGGYDESGVAEALNKPYLIGEAGFSGTYRIPDVDADLDRWLNQRGADGYLQWALMATPYDNGDGDRYVGVDQVFHGGDFWAFQTLFNTWAAGMEEEPSVEVEPLIIEHSILPGQTPPPDVIMVRSTSSAGFSFSVNEDVPWLGVAPQTGTAGCSGTPVTVTYATASLASGIYAGTIEVTADGVAGSPQTVAVTLQVEGRPGDLDGDDDVDIDDFAVLQACISGAGKLQSDVSCQSARLDDDVDVDQADVALFIGCLSGANVEADVDCLSEP